MKLENSELNTNIMNKKSEPKNYTILTILFLQRKVPIDSDHILKKLLSHFQIFSNFFKLINFCQKWRPGNR